jgi:chaperonin GroEL
LKLILRGKEARDALVRGVDCLADAVKVTLGPGGRLAVISRKQNGQTPIVTKDGVTVASWALSPNPQEQEGSFMAWEAAENTRRDAGDGTTTSVVLAQALVHAGMKELDAGKSPAEICASIKSAVGSVVQALSNMALPADGERIAQVATIACNGDAHAGQLVHEAIQRVGKDGVMACEENPTSQETTLEVVTGMQLKRGFISPGFMTNVERQECVLHDALILLHEGKINSAKSLAPAATIAAKIGLPVLIIAGDYEPESVAFLLQNNNRNGFRCCAIRADGWGPRRREILQDLAMMTGGIALTEDLGVKLENFTQEYFGKAKRVQSNQHRTIITEGFGDAGQIDARAQEIRAQLVQSSGEDTHLLQQRLSGLVGGVALIKVGGPTESERREKKDRVEDSLWAAKAAAEEGIVPGGGLALFNAGFSLLTHGHGGIVSEACSVPTKQICANAGIDVNNCGFSDTNAVNAATGAHVNMIESGIVDPLKVVRCALVNAASVACTMIKTEVLIVEVPDEKSH